MKTHPIQTSFAGGEVSERVLGRTETAIYQQAAAIMENFKPDSRGPAMDRGGSEYETAVSSATENIVLETFRVNDSLSYILHFTPTSLIIRTPDNVPPAVGGILAIPHTGAQIDDIRIVIATGTTSSVIYILHKNVNFQRLTYVIASDSFSLTVGLFTGMPASWAGTNWPSAGTIYQGRLWLGNTPSDPQTFWASKSGAYEVFTAGANPDDPILGVTLENQGNIQWFIGTKTLVIGTSTGEYTVKSDTGVISANDLQIDRQSTYGSKFADALMIGNRIFYISPDGTKIRIMEYSFSRDNWISDEANYFSDHLAEFNPFIKIVWAPNPDAILVAVQANGKCSLYTWESETEIHGWSPYVTDGSMLSATSAMVTVYL